jgi:hypothetical protein
MNPEPDFKTLTDEALFALLERPEDWPDDPAVQAELADLLELHLGLMAHGSALETGRVPRRPVLAPWFMAAAAVLVVATPLVYHSQHLRYLNAQASDQARIQDLAQKRCQDRLWSAFFQQSSALLQEFQRSPNVCDRKREDRSEEREVALALLQASHELAGQDAPGPRAEALRSGLHAWLTELSLEDGCLDPARAEELRQQANAQNLQDEAERLGHVLKGDPS